IGEVGDGGPQQADRLMTLAINRHGADVGGQRLNRDGSRTYGLVVHGTADDSGALGALTSDRYVAYVAGQALHGQGSVFAVHTIAPANRSGAGGCVRHRAADVGLLFGRPAFLDLDLAHVG